MKRDDQKTKAELLQELDSLRNRVSELKQAAEEWSKIFDATSDLVFIQDKDFKFVKVNKSVCDVLEVKLEDLVGKKCYEVFHKSDKPWPNCPLAKTLKDKRPHTEEIYDPNIGMPLLISTSPLLDEDGEITGVVHIAKDITERKKAEEALRAAELRYRTLFESIPIGVGLATREGQVLACNKSILQTTGYSDAQIRKINLNDIYQNPQDRELLLKRLHTDGLASDFEVQLRRKDNTIFWASLTVVPVPFVGEDVLLTVAQDITERKKTEESLKREKERAEQYLNTAEVGMVIVNLDENISLINKKGCKILGYKQEELIGKNWFDILVPQRIRSEVRGVFRKLMAEDIEPVEYYENPLLTKDGDERLIAFHNTVIRDLDGKVTGTLSSAEDITERTRIEELLQKSEERLRVALSAAQMGTWRWDPVTNQDTRDASLNMILGLEAVESTQPVEDFLHFVHPEDREMVDAEIQRAIREVRAYLAEFRIIRPDGTVRWLRDQGKPLCDENDRILFLTGAVVDITERKKAEEQLRESKEKYRLLFEGTNTDNVVISIDGVYLMMNEKGAERLGGKPKHFIGKSVYDTFPKDVADEYVRRFRDTAESGGTKTYEDLVELPMGNRWFLTNMWPIKDPDANVTSVQLISQDITERKKAEEALRDSEIKYRTLVENLPQKIFLKDKNSVYVSCNDNLARDLKIRSEEIAGKTDYDFFPEELAEKYRADDKRIIESRETEAIEEKYIQEGKERIVHTVKTPVKDEQGNVIGVLGIFWDITELKRRQEELNIYREKMARAEQLASVGTLSATLAHELTQPLTVVGLSIENSLAELETVSCPSTVLKDLKEGLSEISNMTSMVNRFRNFARKSTKRTVSEVDFKAISERIVKLLDESAWRVKVTLQVEGMDKLPLIYSYERDLEQLFFSLLENAIQAADGKKNRQVIISGAVRDEHIELRFSDNCGGIAPENLNRIFEPFFTTKHADERTGLGLCVVEHIVSQLGGKARVESKLGKGSTFFVTLPIKRDKR